MITNVGLTNTPDPVLLEIFRSSLTAIAEEMGEALTRSSYSPNIKERRDFSCALFDANGQTIAQAAHIPVHLGAMPDSVASTLEKFDEFQPGDVFALNDPFMGGSHLPDISLVSPVFVHDGDTKTLVGFAANRAHHSDVGGISAGSMPIATEIYQEGLIIPPVKLWSKGEPNRAAIDIVLRNVRTPHERWGDLVAQVAANRTAERRLQELSDRFGVDELQRHMVALIDYAERITRAAIEEIPDGTYEFTDYLDDDGIIPDPLPITVTVTIAGSEMTVDFTGSAPETQGSVNTVAAVTKSAVYYVVRCLLPADAPSNMGTFAPITVIAPLGTIVNARAPRAVAAGNVETSQRIADTLLGALAEALPGVIPAASTGTMNNITAGGIDPRSGRPFTYYETMGGGTGACPTSPGESGVHVHMSNTLNTPVEALEYAYPMRISEYRIRDGSGGAGHMSGGDGLVREMTFLVPTQITLLTERRRLQPYGLNGGSAGQSGENIVIRADGKSQLPGKVRLDLEPGDRLSIRSPGGGGWGAPDANVNPDHDSDQIHKVGPCHDT